MRRAPSNVLRLIAEYRIRRARPLRCARPSSIRLDTSYRGWLLGVNRCSELGPPSIRTNNGIRCTQRD